MPGRIFKGAGAAAVILATCAVMATAAQGRALHAMKVDATGLTSTAFFMHDRWFEGDTVETVELAAGSSFLHAGSGLAMRCLLTVTDAGTWAYASECDPFLSGRGTDTLRLIGFRVTLDASPLSTEIMIANINSGTFGASARPVTLLPTLEDYYLSPGPGVIAGCRFGVALDGTVTYPDDSQGCLSGRGTRTLTLHGVPFNVDARELSTASFSVIQAYGLMHQQSDVVQRYRLLPTMAGYPYGGWTVSGILWPSLGLEIGLDGKITYPASANGWVSGRGTDTLVIRGYPIQIDARAVPPNSFHIPDGGANNLGGAVHSLRLAPVSYLYFTGGPNDFRFSIRESDGTIDAGGAACGRGQGTTLVIGCRSVSVEDLTTDEPPVGSTARRTVRVILSEPAPADVTVDYTTADGSATAPGDYVARSGTLTIPAGRTGAPILVTVNGDNTVGEGDERFTISLSNPRGATISRAAATITITDAVPPDTIITAGPAHGSTVTTPPTFAFEAVTPIPRFLECNEVWLGRPATGFRRCNSPYTVVPPGGLTQSRLRFEVRAVDFRGNVDPTPAVRVLTYRPAWVDLSVVGMEITQGVQRLDCASGDGCSLGIMTPDYFAHAVGRNPVRRYQGVALAGQCIRDVNNQPCPAAKPVVARVYVQYRGDAALARGSSVRVSGFDSTGRQLVPNFVLPAARPTGDVPTPCCGSLTTADRLNRSAAYTFELPPDWSRHRSLRLRAFATPARPDIRETRPIDNQLEVVDIQFERPTTIVVRPVLMRIGNVMPSELHTSFAGARAAFPTAFDIQWNRGGVVDASEAALEGDKDEASEVLPLIEDWADDQGMTSGEYPFGLYEPNHGMRSGATERGSDLYEDRPASYAQAHGRELTAVAHELGHGLGLPHAGRKCGSTDGQAGSEWAPDDEGRTAAFGLDTRTPAPYRILGDTARSFFAYDPNFADGTAQWDLMSYCPEGGGANKYAGANEDIHWLSTRNWDHLRDYHEPRDVLPARLASRGVSAAVAVAQASVRTLGVTALIDDDGSVSIRGVRRVTLPPTRSVPGSPWHIVVRDSAGRVLSDIGVAVTTLGHSSTRMLRAKVPAGDAASVQVVKDDAVVAERSRSAHAPQAQVLSPRRGAQVRGRRTTVRWRASDVDDDELTVSLDYSADGGRGWSTIFIGPDHGRVTLPTRLLTASRNARLRIRANDGFEEAVTTSDRFVSAGARPAVSIQKPSRAVRVRADATLVAQGEAHDDAGHRLTGRRLTWRLGRRIVGRGQEITVTELPAGRRTLRLTGRDSWGRTGTASVPVRVLPVAPQFVELERPQSISHKSRRVRMRIITNVSATLRIGGRPFHVSRRPRTISVRIRPGRQALRLHAVLTSGGRRSAATVVIARRR